jgi:CRISPR-associated protein Csm3
MLTNRALLGKVIIRGNIKCLTGLHIGASKDNMEIGAIDSPVVRDPITREPYIPGSSLKGKLRSLLEKAHSLTPNRDIGTDVRIHVCKDDIDAANCQVCRVFGSTGDRHNSGKNFPARLIVRDLHLTSESVDKLNDIDTGLQYTEWKFENAIDRITSAANPRQIERVPRGAGFKCELVYNVEDVEHMVDDMKNINLAIKLVEADALGGHGSRGYGQVKFDVEAIEAKSIDNFKGVDTSISKKIISFENIEDLKTVFTGASTGDA